MLMIMREQIKEEFQIVLERLERLIELAEPYKDEGWLLDTLDKINELSIRY